jgi:hypothetical protein
VDGTSLHVVQAPNIHKTNCGAIGFLPVSHPFSESQKQHTSINIGPVIPSLANMADQKYAHIQHPRMVNPPPRAHHANIPTRSIVSRTSDTLFNFFALYFTTLFSLDTWAAARNSPHRAPSTNAFYRPTNTLPEPDSYQGGMHGRGNAGPGSGSGGGRDVGRVPQVRDSRPPIPMASMGSCSTCTT